MGLMLCNKRKFKVENFSICVNKRADLLCHPSVISVASLSAEALRL